jgi:hypothetical protein
MVLRAPSDEAWGRGEQRVGTIGIEAGFTGLTIVGGFHIGNCRKTGHGELRFLYADNMDRPRALTRGIGFT